MPDTITDYIREDMKARLRGGGGLPDKLTLAALAEYYQVSFTPVRLALHGLLREQVLLKHDNGRMTVNPDAAVGEPVPPPPPRPVGAEAGLIHDLIQRGLRGDGEYLREEATALRLGVGRTVLRQILNRLAGQGLVEHLPRRGWKVRCFEEAEMQAYLQARESLELKALELAKSRLVKADLRRMLRGNKPVPGEHTARLDNQLHDYIIDKAGNRFIRDFFDSQGIYFTTLFAYAAPETHVVRRMARQHRDILRALIAEDWRAARRALARHIRSQGPIVRKLLRKMR
jgi:DNA-binding GntR family transcriptional regulator